MEQLSRIVQLAAVVVPGVAFAGGLAVVEPGFTVTELEPGVGAKQIECSPGGIWGDYVYVADSSGNTVDRIAYDDTMSLFATGLAFPVGLAFGPGPAGDFGDFLFVTNYGEGTISRVDPDGVVSLFVQLPDLPASNTFDPLGAYGNGMFVAQGAFTGPIVTIEPKGDIAVFSDVEAAYLKFGPGGAWGTGLYSTSHDATPGIVRVDPDGNETPLVLGLVTPEGFDWAFGSIFAGHLFATDVSEGEIHRVRPDGTRTLWARVDGAADVAFCNGALYVVSAAGGCYRVTVTCPADLDTSGEVDFEDLLAVLDAWGDDGGPADLNGDGTVDFEDLLVVLDTWGPCA